MSTSRCVATLLALLGFASPAWANDPSLQIIGWSADEQRFAVREYDLVGGEETGDESTPCPGYVDHEGHPFMGSLTLSVYEKGKQLATYPIQDNGKCTPPKEAKARLTKAKQAMAKLGIDPSKKQPGTELTPDEHGRVTVKEGPGAPYTLEAEDQQTQDKKAEEAKKADKTAQAQARDGKAPEAPAEQEEEEFDPNKEIEVDYSLVVSVNKGGERRQLFSQRVKGSYYPMMAGRYTTDLHRVWLSPGGRTVVFVTLSSSGNMRGHDDSLDVLGVLSWGGEPLVLR